ncbi:MAG: multicopper oxidase domain-containing protein [Nitrososphaerales archaeon]
MHRESALIGSAGLLVILIIGVIITAYIYTPVRGVAPKTVIVASTSSAERNQTELVLGLRLSNGSIFDEGNLTLGTYNSQVINQSYIFQNISPGSYSLNLTDVSGFFLPPATLEISKGENFARATIYPLVTFSLIETGALTYNGTRPGPSIVVKNGTAIILSLTNNTTQINDFAVVRDLGNTSQSNVLFNSLSNTLGPGGSSSDIFIVSSPGFYYYTSLIGSQSKDGQFGYFLANT